MLHIHELLTFITQHAVLTYGAIFLISLSESLAVVGLFIPGTVIMFGIGAVVATGSLEIKPVLLLAIAGAIIGDGISYWLGHYYRDNLRKIWPFSHFPGMLINGEAFFERHGGKSVLLGRFVGPVRPIIPVVAGMLGMSPVHFSIVNVLSAIGWALVYILPGVFFGTSLEVAGAISTHLAILILLFLAISWIAFWFGRKLILLAVHRGPTWLVSLKEWSTTDTPAHWLLSPLKRILSRLFFRLSGDELFFVFLILILCTAGWGFLGVLQDVLARDPLVLADQAFYHFFQALHIQLADRFFITIVELSDLSVTLCLAGVVLLVLLGKRCYRSAGFWAITILGGLAGIQSLSWLVHLPQPVVISHGTLSHGFPDSHTAINVIFYGFFAILLTRGPSSAWRWGLFIIVVLLSFFIALSRVYLGIQPLSTVLGGFFIGTSWITLLGIGYLMQPTENVPRRRLGFVILVVIAVAGSWQIKQHSKKELALYAHQYNIQFMSRAAWLDHGWSELHTWRIDMFGEQEQPLTVQWAGLPDKLARYLLCRGWQHPPSLSLKNFLEMFTPDMPIEKLPVLPHFHNGRVDHLRLVYPNKDNRWLLRLWPTDVRITKNNIPLFIGTIEVQHHRQLTGLFSTAQDTNEYDSPLLTLEQELHKKFTVKPVNREKIELHISHEPHRLPWQGRVLLIWKKANGRIPGMCSQQPVRTGKHHR